MQDNAKENNSTAAISEKTRSEFASIEAKAQYEVFRNGDLPRETIKGWIENDLKAILSFVSGVLNDSELNDAIVDAYYKRYQKLHAKDATKNQTEMFPEKP